MNKFSFHSKINGSQHTSSPQESGDVIHSSPDHGAGGLLDVSLLSEPDTPELSPGALNTTVLRNFVGRDLGSSSTTINFDEVCTVDLDAKSAVMSATSKPICEAAQDDVDLLAAIDSFSSLKTSKILQPRRTGPRELEDCAPENWIPEISAAEWDSAPSFLKIQV